MRYCVLYPQAENVHLIKDVGMIAYKLFKAYDYDASVACYENGSYDYLKKEVKGLKLNFIKRRYNNDILDGISYIKRNAKSIDVLQLFHVTLRTVFYTLIYKFFNPKGKIFVKLDCTNRLIDVIKSLNGIKYKMLNAFLNKVDIIGVEQETLYEQLRNILSEQSKKLLIIPNGIDFQGADKYNSLNFKDKENIILHVGRIGSPEKATDILLNAVKNIKDIENSGWKINIVGPIEEKFKEYIDDFFEKNAHLKGVVEFKGAVYDREQLFEEYKKAKIFCLSSNYESFGIALIEAASFGDVIVSTDVGIAKELVRSNNGIIVDVQDEEMFSKSIEKLMYCDDLYELSALTEKICREKYDWNNIIEVLHQRILNINRG
ncbi:glycosyltransferase family 4 protein [Clostridium sp. YIM B02515]|uniref:Glycosyltransferase family 4 protein n=1 Tax=Clostridium rhizosphaerae TaxID=2803861 RepID=A0ABS1TFH1_9CLOT|nr:glycosyltransferase family 4 protein [Clostridium rhizosphaerae]